MAKKRANGEGNIRKRKDGRWEGRYTAGYDPETGKRIIKNVLGKTQAEVKEKLVMAMDDAKDLDVARSDDYTVGSWLTNWYMLYARPNVRVSTAEYYRRSIELHINPRIGGHQAKQIDRARPAKTVSRPPRKRQVTRGSERKISRPECLHGTWYPPHAPQRTGQSRQGTPYPTQPHGRLHRS